MVLVKLKQFTLTSYAWYYSLVHSLFLLIGNINIKKWPAISIFLLVKYWNK